MAKLFPTDEEFYAAINSPKQAKISPHDTPAVGNPAVIGATIVPFNPEWPEPAQQFLPQKCRPAPVLPLQKILPPHLAEWVTKSAESKGCPPDYVFSGLLSVVSSAIGNSRAVSPWDGWSEPSVLWFMIIGNPSAGKSPGLDAALTPFRSIETSKLAAVKKELAEWTKEKEIADMVKSVWAAQNKKELRAGGAVLPKPIEAEMAAKPVLPRLIVNDATIERIAVILDKQPRGLLLARDELAGWLIGMERYAGGGSDRPFFLEAYGARPYTVERMSREAITVERLSVSIVGGIQPDRLNTLLLSTDDDGLLARIIPVWPDPVPIKMPDTSASNDFIQRILDRLLGLSMFTDKNGVPQPVIICFSENAKNALNEFRKSVRELENEAEGLILSFLGKLPGMVVRLSLVIQYLDWASDGVSELDKISSNVFGRAVNLVMNYLLPMAHRAYAEASVPEDQVKALQLVRCLRKNSWKTFSSRDVLRRNIRGLNKSTDLNPILAQLEDGDVIRPIKERPSASGGRPIKKFMVNPAIFLD